MRISIIKIAVLSLFILPFQASSQNWKEHMKDSIGKKYFIGASFGAQYSNLKVNTNFAWETLYEGVKFFEKDDSYYGHLQFGVVLNKRIDFIVGIAYNERKIIQTTDFPYVDCATTTWGSDVTLDAHRRVKIRNFGVPIEFRFKFGTDRIMFYPAIGATADFGLRKSQTVDIFLENGTICSHPLNSSSLIHNKDINIGIQGKIGARLKIIDSIYLKSEAFYKIYGGREGVLTDFNSTNLYSYGLLAGFEYFL